MTSALTLQLPKDIQRHPSVRQEEEQPRSQGEDALPLAQEEDEEAADVTVLENESDLFANSPRSDEEDGDEKLVGKFDGFRVKSGRISLVDFTSKVSDVDKAALSRRPTALLELEAELLRAESRIEDITVQLSVEQINSMR
jgi:hypothetical protein